MTRERDAAEFGAELLLSQAALLTARKGMPNEQVASHSDVGVPLAKWRMDATDARIIVEQGGRRFDPDRGLHPRAARRRLSYRTTATRARTSESRFFRRPDRLPAAGRRVASSILTLIVDLA